MIIQNGKAVFGTYEWSNASANFISGCRHDCKYCYSKEMAIRFNRSSPDAWKNERVRGGALRRHFPRVKGTIMFPSSHDIHPDHLQEAIGFLERMLLPGNRVLVVSKPHLECIRTICARFTEFRSSILFRFTIGSATSDTLRFWEPGAPDFTERLACLRLAFDHGYETSVSCEPMLDRDVDALIAEVSPFVTDAIWLGKANFLLRRLAVNCVSDPETLRRAVQLNAWQSDDNIRQLYRRLQHDQRIRWKESIKRVVGIRIPTERGLDV